MNFSASYAQVPDTTGYTPNKGVWAKVMFHQKRGPFTKKRRKWHQNFGGDPSFYQISERDEEEDVKLPQIIIANQDLSVPIIETMPKRPSFIKDKTPSIPKIVVEDCPTDYNKVTPRVTERKQEQDSAFLMPPTWKRSKPLFARKIPEAAVYETCMDKENNSEALQTNRYLTSPKYTHIRVPRRHAMVTHVSQESLDSPLRLPRINAETPYQRKPVMVTLTKGFSHGKKSVRKRWNFNSLTDPIQIYTGGQSPDSEMTVPSLKTPSACLDHEEHSLLDTDNAKKDVQTNKDPQQKSGSLPVKDKKSVVSVARNGAVSIGQKSRERKKWVLPEHWPSQDPALGQ